MVIEKADEWRPDLIVVGSHGRSALGRFMLGSVSQKVVTEAHCSVRVARGHGSDTEAPARLLIGVDGSPDAEAAITAVATRVWPADSEARVVMALDDVVSEVIDQIEGGRAWIHETIETAGARLRAAGLTVSSLIRNGAPQKRPSDEAASWGRTASSSGREVSAALNGSGWAASPPPRRLARIARSRSCDSEGGPSEDSRNA
jgi:hypothetical protein